MKEAGARADEETQRVYLEKDRYGIPSYESRHTMSGICTNIYDPYTGERRESTKDDVRNVGRVFQKASTGAVAWTGCLALDVPEKTHCLHEMAAIIQGTSKHVQFELSNVYEADYAKKILELISGSKEEFLQRKTASVLYCPVSPLTQDAGMLDADVRTGTYVKSGEAPLISLGGTAMARYYGLPCCVTGGGTFETMPAYLGGADLIDGIGTCDNGMAVSLEMILTEDEIGQRILRICRGIRVDAHTDLVDEIKEEGPGGAFIAHRSTLRNFRDRDEIYFSPYFSSKLRGTINEKADSVANANKMVRKILEGPIEDELPEDVIAAMDRICAEADAFAGVEPS